MGEEGGGCLEEGDGGRGLERWEREVEVWWFLGGGGCGRWEEGDPGGGGGRRPLMSWRVFWFIAARILSFSFWDADLFSR